MSKIASLVHTLETTASSTLPTNYQNFRKASFEPEWHRTEILYEQTDEAGGTNRAEKLRDCRKYAYFARHTDTGKVRIISNSCRQRWCPICSRVRSIQLSEQVVGWLKKVKRPKFLTLTTAHSSLPLSEQVSNLYRHFRLFRQRKFISEKWKGGLWFFQVKRSPGTGEWHPHLHCVIDGDYVPQSELSLEWLYTTEHSFILDIRAIRSEEKIADYVARYCARPVRLLELTEDDAQEVFTAFHGRRLCGTWGTGKHCSLRPPKCEDSDKWIRIASYKTVLSSAGRFKRAQAIINCFQNNIALPTMIRLREIDKTEVLPTKTEIFQWGIEDFNLKAEVFQ